MRENDRKESDSVALASFKTISIHHLDTSTPLRPLLLLPSQPEQLTRQISPLIFSFDCAGRYKHTRKTPERKKQRNKERKRGREGGGKKTYS